jgi:hypothetical protein
MKLYYTEAYIDLMNLFIVILSFAQHIYVVVFFRSYLFSNMERRIDMIDTATTHGMVDT